MNKPVAAISIRPQMVKDAARLFEILTNGGFKFFPANVASIEAEKRFLRKNIKQLRADETWNFSILLGDRLIGSIGVMPESSRPHCAEIGYFIDSELHGCGYALEAVRLVEDYILENQQHIRRLYACIVVDNLPSTRVIEKAGFACEGRLAGYLKVGQVFYDAWLYGKLIR